MSCLTFNALVHKQLTEMKGHVTLLVHLAVFFLLLSIAITLYEFSNINHWNLAASLPLYIFHTYWRAGRASLFMHTQRRKVTYCITMHLLACARAWNITFSCQPWIKHHYDRCSLLHCKPVHVILITELKSMENTD